MESIRIRHVQRSQKAVWGDRPDLHGTHQSMLPRLLSAYTQAHENQLLEDQNTWARFKDRSGHMWLQDGNILLLLYILT